jgi:ribosome biogenesis GTPase A
MAELKIKCEQPEFLKLLFQDTLRDRIENLEKGIKLTRERLVEFEIKYQLSTVEFLRRFANDEIQHRLDRSFDEWIGESRMLKTLQEKLDLLKGVEFFD